MLGGGGSVGNGMPEADMVGLGALIVPFLTLVPCIRGPCANRASVLRLWFMAG